MATAARESARGSSQLELVRALHMLHRTLVSDGFDEALAIVGERMPPAAGWAVENFPSGEPAWTWKVPPRYVVHEARLETEDGRKIVDFADHPLHLVSYSEPVDAVLDWDELEPRLHVSEERPWAIPFEFSFYTRRWGFCLSKDLLETLPRGERYRALIRSEFVEDPDRGLRVGVGVIDPQGGHDPQAGEFVVCAHVDHPGQANDDAAGVATAVELARRLAASPLPPGSMRVRFLFCAEGIGSITWMSRHEDLIPHLRGGLFCEMTGNDNSLCLQRSRQDDHLLDRVARAALSRRGEHREAAFRDSAANDEMTFNGPGVNAPTVSISRFPYPEYHTSDDTPEIVGEDRLAEAADVAEEIVRTYASNYVPLRRFRGPLFLSGHGLWVDYRDDPALSLALEKVMLRLEGEHTVFDIADELGLDYGQVRDYVERMVDQGLVARGPIPATGDRGAVAGG